MESEGERYNRRHVVDGVNHVPVIRSRSGPSCALVHICCRTICLTLSGPYGSMLLVADYIKKEK